MLYFKALFRLVLKGFFTKRNIILLVVLLLLSIYCVQNGIKEYKKEVEKKNEFKSIELSFFNDVRNYNQYSYVGFKTLFIPSGSSVFFSNPILLSELSAKINSVITLNIVSNCKGGLVLKGNSSFTTRFSNVVFVLVCLLVLFLGFEIMREREFLRFLSSKWSKFGVFISITFSLVILFTLCLLVIFACCIGLTVLQGISLTSLDVNGLVIVLVPMILKLLFFFFFGTIFGSIRSKYTGISGLLAVWIIFIFIYPGAINSFIEEKSCEITSSYKADKDKLKRMNDFEKRAAKKAGEYKDSTIEGRRRVAEDFWENERKQIEEVDEKLKQEISQLIDKYNTLSMLMPTTFYTYTCNEVSSRGYQSYLDFYTYLQDLRRKFVRFWIDRVYYHDPKILVNFVTNDENLFYSRSQIPKNYWVGVFINLGIIILLAITSYLLFKRSLEHISAREIQELGKVDLDLDKGELIVWLTINEHFKKVLFHMFSGVSKGLFKKGFKGEVYFDGVNVAEDTSKNNFVYICHPNELPGNMIVKDLLTFYAGWNQLSGSELKTILAGESLKKNLHKTIKQLEKYEKFEVSMGLLNMCKSDIYLINNIASGMPMSCSVKLLNKMEELQSNSLVIYLTTPEEVDMPSLPGGSYFEEDDIWINLVKSTKRIIEMANK